MRTTGVKIAIDSGKRVGVEPKEKRGVSVWLLAAVFCFAIAIFTGLKMVVG